MDPIALALSLSLSRSLSISHSLSVAISPSMLLSLYKYVCLYVSMPICRSLPFVLSNMRNVSHLWKINIFLVQWSQFVKQLLLKFLTVCSVFCELWTPEELLSDGPTPNALEHVDAPAPSVLEVCGH